MFVKSSTVKTEPAAPSLLPTATFRSVVAQAAVLACAVDPAEGVADAPVVGAVADGALDEDEPALGAEDDDGAAAALELELAELHPATSIAAMPSVAPASDMRPCAVNVIGIPLWN
jgi:hypothetical protein